MGRPKPTPEPEVVTKDVQAILRRVIRPDLEDDGASVALIAELAKTSTRTVYRVLDKDARPTLSLDLADRLCMSADAHLSECRVVPAGSAVAC